MFTKNHKNADPDYINIGDTELIKNRSIYDVKITPPNGLLGEYVPFYFGPLSPMLLRIRDGKGGVVQRPQHDIVYVVCRVNDLISLCRYWCFTNGHAKNIITDFYNDIRHLNQIDWDMVYQQYWANTEEDYDRMRRKQAEFLVKDHVPVSCISAVVVYNENAKAIIGDIVAKLGLSIPVYVKRNFYY